MPATQTQPTLYKPMLAPCLRHLRSAPVGAERAPLALSAPRSCPVFAIRPVGLLAHKVSRFSGEKVPWGIRVSVSSIRVSVHTSAPIHRSTETGLYSISPF